MSQAPPLAVEMKGIVKSFDDIPVLRGVDFELQTGQVHAMMGGNGAGKSTLMKILEGVYTPDAGTIAIEGHLVQIPNPYAARALGIGMVFQEFSLIPSLTVAQNIFLTHEPRTSLGLVNDAEAQRRASALFTDMGVEIDPHATVSSLSTGYWQLTEIAKALSQNARILIMDEPTAALTISETQGLFALIRKLKARGISIIYISHRIEEIFAISDRVTVLRDGQRVLSAQASDLTMSQLVEAIIGRKLERAFEWQERHVNRAGAPLLQVHELKAGPKVKNISFHLHAGEILGIAGLMGSGRSELVRALFGIDRIESGQVLLRGKPIKLHSPQDALAAGICLIPEDRRGQGLILAHDVKDNMLLPVLNRLSRYSIIDDRKADQLAHSYVESLSIKTDSIHKLMRLLSGGNQQKVVIAKWLAAQPQILLLDEPMAGVDIGAKTEILDVIRALANEGKAIVLISSEFTELLAVADRVLIIRNGTIKQELARQEIETEQMLEQVVQRTSAKEVQLSAEQLEKIRELQATAALSLHYRGDDWSAAQIQGLYSQFDKMGVRVVAVTDANFQPLKQVSDIEDLLAAPKKPDIIISIPTDPIITANAFRKASAQGVKVVFMDNVPKGLVQGIDYVSVVSADNYGNGVSSAHIMAVEIKQTGKIGIIFHTADYFVTRQRYVAFKRTIEDTYPKIEIVAEVGVGGPDFASEAEKGAAEMLRQHPDLKGIWAVWDVPAEGVMAAIRHADRTDVIVTTIDLGKNVAIEIAKNGIVKGLGAQRPFDQGITEAVLAGYALLGEPVPTDVVFDGLPVTRNNVLDAWKTIYHQDPPRELKAAMDKNGNGIVQEVGGIR